MYIFDFDSTIKQAMSYNAQCYMEDELVKNHSTSLESRLGLVVVMWSDYLCASKV